jgi:hypothetical protein
MNQSEHVNLMQIDMEYRVLNRRKLELEKKKDLSETEKIILENINETMQEMRGDIEINDD